MYFNSIIVMLEYEKAVRIQNESCPSSLRTKVQNSIIILDFKSIVNHCIRKIILYKIVYIKENH